jgi:transcriptional regulator with XRE-family HTH domain
MSLGQTIRHRRCQLNLTQEELAGSNLTKSFISQLERNQTNASLVNLKLLASKLQMSVTDLVASDDPLLQAETAYHLACAYILMHKPDQAQRWIEQAWDIIRAQDIEEHPLVGQVYYIRGYIALMQDRQTEAFSLLDQALAQAKKLDQKVLICQNLLALGQLRYEQNLLLKAARFLEEARETFFAYCSTSNPLLGVEILDCLIRINTELGDVQEAAQLSAQKNALLSQAADFSSTATRHIARAEQLHQANRHRAAQIQLHKAIALLELEALCLGNV